MNAAIWGRYGVQCSARVGSNSNWFGPVRVAQHPLLRFASVTFVLLTPSAFTQFNIHWQIVEFLQKKKIDVVLLGKNVRLNFNSEVVIRPSNNLAKVFTCDDNVLVVSQFIFSSLDYNGSNWV